MPDITSPRPAAATSSRLGRVHTVRIPDPLWDLHTEQSQYENRRDGVSELIRELMEDHARVLLRGEGITIGDYDDVTGRHVVAYRAALAKRGPRDA